MPQIQTQRREQKRERNGERYDQCPANVAKEDEQNDRDQDDSLGQVMEHGMRGQMDQVASVQVRNDLHTGRKKMIVEEVDLFMQRGEDVVRRRRLYAARQYRR